MPSRIASLIAVVAGLAAMAKGAELDFARDVQPVLSDNCFQCHGPASSGRKGGLRLDLREGAYGAGKSGRVALVPGRPEASEIMRRIEAEDPGERMPPAESNKSLTAAQRALLRRWIAEGGRWGEHWAFVPPRASVVPRVPGPAGANPIDAFVAARLAAEGARLAPPAEPARLLRRVALDLTGLPPTPAESAAFEADPSPEAYARVVDRLLASPRRGERMASEWLDLARFADTHGFQMDRYRPMWPWRDWVIGAFNHDLPFDQFVLWQLAGDLLPGATREQRLATAFNRLHLQNEEGGIVEEEYRVAYVVDRVNTFGTAFLGMTFECSRCHDHKFDPVSQREFYQMFSFFQNIDESGQTVYFGEIMPVPTLLLATDAQETELAGLRERIAAQEAVVVAARGSAGGDFRAWLAAGGAPSLTNGLVGSFSFDAMVSNRFPNAAGAGTANPFENPATVPGRAGSALGLDGENGVSMPGVGAFTRADPFGLALWIRPGLVVPRQTVLHRSQAWMDAGSRGYEILLEDGRVAVGLHHMWPGNSLKVRTRAALAAGAWSHVAVSYDGSSRAAGLVVYLDGRRAEVEVIRDGLWKDITYGEPALTVGQRMRDSGFKQGAVDELRVYARAVTAVEAMLLSGNGMPDEGALLDYYVSVHHGPSLAARAELDRLRRRQNALVTGIPDIMAMREMDRPKPAHILRRGAYDQPGDAVEADTPAVLGRLPAGTPRNRLGLARWLLDPGHPLMGRVTVNRAWQQFFGRGLVETSDNFGLQGARPAHPELLDWLAVAFVRGDAAAGLRPWSLSDLQRLIVTSATYRQSSRATAAEIAADPANVRLGRGPARRLSAEMLRDQALLAAGLLVEKIGGPSVKPYQPDGLWEVAMGNPRYDTGRGEDLHRRSLYTFWKRTVPPPAMIALDAADRSYCVARRQSTSTPLQALALLNDTQVVEAARHVGARMLREGGDAPEARVRYAFRLVTGRAATEAEADVLLRLLEEQHGEFVRDPEAAPRLLKVGETPVPGEHPAADLAAATVLAKALLNHDEAVMSR